MPSPLISHRHTNYSNNNCPKKVQAKASQTKPHHSRSISMRSRSRDQSGRPKLQSKYSVHHEDKLKVYLRFKPSANNCANNVRYLSETEVEIEKQTRNMIYNFDHVFHHESARSEVMAVGCKDMIDEALDEGRNGLIFVYGPTGTGKTYTMGLLEEVSESSEGIVPESIRYMFSKQVQGMTVSFTEIYMDEVYDLLDYEGDKKLAIREDTKTKEPYIQNLISIAVGSADEACQLINIGLERRRVAEQKMNKRSSRGHGIITLHTHYHNKATKLCFVDLAGSERIKESDSYGVTLNEAVHINSSLSALETLLMNIDDRGCRMYRANKLTRLLQPFIESGKVRLFVTSNYENAQPIEFGKRCKGIKFMERQTKGPMTPDKKRHSQYIKAGKSESAEIESLLAQNQRLTYCISNLIGILFKTNEFISQMIACQKAHSSFSLPQTLQIRNEALEAATNTKINRLEQAEEHILCKQNSRLFEATPKQLLSLLTEPKEFLSKVHEIGFQMFQSVKQLSDLTEYRNVYKKQVFVNELKVGVLENKNSQLQTAVNYLLKAQPVHTRSRVQRELKQLGILIQSNCGSSDSAENFCSQNIAVNKRNPKEGNAKSAMRVAQSRQLSACNTTKTPVKGQSDMQSDAHPYDRSDCPTWDRQSGRSLILIEDL